MDALPHALWLSATLVFLRPLAPMIRAACWYLLLKVTGVDLNARRQVVLDAARRSLGGKPGGDA